jgi:hypothetical protein
VKQEPSTRAQAPAGLQKHAIGRTHEVVVKLRSAMKIVEGEIDEHEGIYPLNNGRLNQAEICRRAGISNVTLSTAAHRDTTKKMVDDWVRRIKNATVTGSKSVRKAVTNRADDWKRAHAAIAQSYRIAELELLDMKSSMKKLATEVQRLSDENTALRQLLETSGASKVVPLAKNVKSVASKQRSNSDSKGEE